MNNDVAARKDHDAIFDPLKEAVVQEAMDHHVWDSKALNYLRVIQLNAIEDRAVPDRRSWDSACTFMQRAASARLEDVKRQLTEARGPGWFSKWVYWQTPSADNHFCCAVQDELNQILQNDPVGYLFFIFYYLLSFAISKRVVQDHKQALTDEDITVVRRAIETKGIIDVPTEVIRRQWKMVFKRHFLEKIVQVSFTFFWLQHCDI